MYRVDKRDYKICDIISNPEISYQSLISFSNEKILIEEILENEKPSTIAIERKSCLYIFSELADAIKFSLLMTDSKIYKVQQLNTNFYHKGDMNFTEVMNEYITDKNILRQLAKSYWAGKKTFKPSWEILVDKIQVKEIISNDENRKKMLYEFNENPNIEKLNFYITQLQNNNLR